MGIVDLKVNERLIVLFYYEKKSLIVKKRKTVLDCKIFNKVSDMKEWLEKNEDQIELLKIFKKEI